MHFRILIALSLITASGPLTEARAGFFETSVGGSYNKSNYDGGSYASTRRYGATFGYNFMGNSSIELGYQHSVEKTHYAAYQDAEYKDQVYSMNWVQNLAGREAAVQPYVKGGIGQLNREATVTLNTGQSQTTVVDSITGVAGLGLRIRLSSGFALRFEGTSYLVGGRIKTWNQNFGVTAGGSLYF